jgi:hypothetical protein
MILYYFAEFDQLAELNPNAEIRLFSRKRHPELSSSVVGTFSIVNGLLVCLYRKLDILYFSVADNDFEIRADTSSSLESLGAHQKFRLLKGKEVLVELTQLTPHSEIPLSIDPTPFVEEEHFNFLLFVHNVLTDPGRRYRVWNQ